MHAVTSVFWQKLQGDNLHLAEIVDLEFPQNSLSFHWTTANHEITKTLSGASKIYSPLPGAGGNIEDNLALGVAVMQFTLTNTDPAIQASLLSQDFALASLKAGWIFTDTPDCGRLDFYQGKIGDFSYNRLELQGQARNLWKSLNVQWPYYTYQEKCVWRFGSAGCGFNTASVTLSVTTINVASSTPLDLLLNSGTLAAYANGRFDYGRVTIIGGANSGSIRTIRTHSGDALGLSHILPHSDLTGCTLSIYPGCKKRLTEDCHSLYNNTSAFFGWPWITGKFSAY